MLNLYDHLDHMRDDDAFQASRDREEWREREIMFASNSREVIEATDRLLTVTVAIIAKALAVLVLVAGASSPTAPQIQRDRCIQTMNDVQHFETLSAFQSGGECEVLK